MRFGAVPQLLLGFRKADVDADLARLGARPEGTQSDRGLAGAGAALQQVEPVPGKPSVKHFVQPGDAGGGTRQTGWWHSSGDRRCLGNGSHPPRTVTRAGRHSLTPRSGPSSRWARCSRGATGGARSSPWMARQRHTGFGKPPFPRTLRLPWPTAIRLALSAVWLSALSTFEGLLHAALLLRSRGR